MKTIFKSFACAAAAALALASCAKENLVPNDGETDGKKLVKVHFSAETTDPASSRATLTPDEGETAFAAAWGNDDQIAITYTYVDLEVSETVPGIWKDSDFSADITDLTTGDELATMSYAASYPYSQNGEVDFGSERTQSGGGYNSKYDIMVSAKVEATAKPGLDVNGNKIVFPMERQTAIAYFHFTSDNAEEDITKATLTVEGGSIAAGRALLAPSDFTPDLDSSPLSEIVLNVTGQKADDFTLWFNVLPTSYTKMTLTVETATKTFTISKNSEGTYEAGKLYKVKKDGIAWTDVEESIAECIFYESFDTNDGKGGNDGEWSGSIATNAFSSDNKGWTPGANAKGAYQCVKLGAGSAKGNITTPALGIPEGTNVTFKFMAAAWNGTDEKTGLNISIAEGCKGTITPGTITLKKGEWTIYENYIITGGDADTKVKIEAQEASKNRFFLDEVEVWTEGKIPASYNVNIAAADGGKVSASKTRAPEGAEITLTATPDEGYEFIENSWKVVAADDSEITVTDGKFIMPASDVTVTASFVRKPYLNAVASKTTISADGETVTVTVDTNVDGGWTAESSDETNFTIGNKTATTFDVTVSKNETEAAREATITVTAGRQIKTITLKQNVAGQGGDTKYFVKVTSITTGKQYLLVDGTHIFDGSNISKSTPGVDCSELILNDKIESNETTDKYAVKIITSGTKYKVQLSTGSYLVINATAGSNGDLTSTASGEEITISAQADNTFRFISGNRSTRGLCYRGATTNAFKNYAVSNFGKSADGYGGNIVLYELAE